MSCYNPLIRIEDLSKYVKAEDGHLYHPATIIKQEALNDLDTLKKYQGGMHYKASIIPCGKCIGCRLDYSKEWANRAYLESLLYKDIEITTGKDEEGNDIKEKCDCNWFITLTYKDEELTKNEEFTDKNGFTWTIEDNERATLCPQDLHTFINTFRQLMYRDYGLTGIRYLACGEYGEDNLRPHYHIIFLNCPLPTKTFYNARLKRGYWYYQNTLIERAWTKGISNISEASWNCISYTARYITKKINGELENEIYWANGIEKEFFRMSRDPGIGKPYYDLHKHEIYKHDSIMIKNLSGVHYEKPPKFFDDLYKAEYPDKWKEIQWKREQEGRNATKLGNLETSLFKREQLKIEERSKQAQSKALTRPLENKTTQRKPTKKAP